MEHQDSILFPIIRYGLIGLGTSLVKSGFIDAALLEGTVGAVMTLGTTGWMVYNKRFKRQISK